MRDAIDLASRAPFMYGQHDCCLFAAFVVDRMCDTDYYEQIRMQFRYSDEFAAINIIDSNGGLYEMTRKFLGDPIPVRNALPGDVLLLRNDGKALLAILEGHQAVAAAESGVVPLPLTDAICAWRIE